MPAAVETMAYVGEVPWHGLGVDVPPGLTGDAFLQAAGLDWTVELRPIYLEDGREVEGFKASTRSTDGTVFGVVGSRFVPIQNADLFGLPDEVVRRGLMTYQTAGSLQDGRTVWALASFPGAEVRTRGGRTDELERHVLWAAGHDGGRSLVGGLTTVRVVCQNTLDAAAGSGSSWGQNLQNRFRVKHTKSAGDRLKEANRVLVALAEQAERETAMYQALADAPMTRAEMDAFSAELLDSLYGPIELVGDRARMDGKADTPEVTRLIERARARRERQRVELGNAFEDSPGAEGASRWDAYNAVTYREDHGKRSKSAETRFESALLSGGIYTHKGIALDLLTRELDAPSRELVAVR
jgi:phage/plasmid-like protein (TIGR03299 family)